jgi:ligand-binding sensor domain-containing protein
MSKKLFFSITILSLILSIKAIAQQQDVANRIRGTNTHYEAGDWTSYSMTRWITSLAEGRENVYFGTSGGVLRYNFYSNKWDTPWTTSDGLADNYVQAVAYDFNTDYFWCSTPQGVSVYRTNFRRWENFFKDEFGLPLDDEIISIGFDDQYVWLESKSWQFFWSQNQQGYFARVSASDVPVQQINWFGQRGNNLGNLPNFMMHDGYFFDPSGFIRDYRLNTYRVTSYLNDRWGVMWIGSWGAGAGKADYRIQILELLPYGLFIKNVNAMEMDSEGNIWAGGIGVYGEESGITYWDTRLNTWTNYQARFNNSLFSDQVTSIALDDSCIWFGTQCGLVCFSPEKNDWRTFDVSWGLGDNYVYDVEVDSANVWIGTANGLSQIIKDSLGTKKFRIQEIGRKDLLRKKVYAIEIMKNLLWLGTEYGVYIYDTAKKTGGFEDDPNGPMNDEVRAVGIYEDKEVWFGLADGVEVFNMESKTWGGVPERRFLSSTFVNYIAVDSSAAWIATDNGVLKFDKARQRWVHFNTEDGLLSNDVNCILLDGDYVWFGTPEGLTRFYWNAPYRID